MAFLQENHSIAQEVHSPLYLRPIKISILFSLYALCEQCMWLSVYWVLKWEYLELADAVAVILKIFRSFRILLCFPFLFSLCVSFSLFAHFYLGMGRSSSLVCHTVFNVSFWFIFFMAKKKWTYVGARKLFSCTKCVRITLPFYVCFNRRPTEIKKIISPFKMKWKNWWQ